MDPGSPRLGLALSGGIARTIVHVGVLKALEDARIRVGLIAGTSGGALIGALYAAGLPAARLEAIAHEVHWRDLAEIRPHRMGLFSSEGISRFLIRQMGDLAFADLRLPFGVVATDLISGHKVVLREGRVAEAVRASCGLPQVYTPVELDGRLLVDGALVEFLPAQTAREMGADIVLGVNARSSVSAAERPRNMLQVAVQALNIISNWNLKPSEQACDFVLHPNVFSAGPFSLEAASSLIAAGYASVQELLPRIREATAGGGEPA